MVQHHCFVEVGLGLKDHGGICYYIVTLFSLLELDCSKRLIIEAGWLLLLMDVCNTRNVTVACRVTNFLI